MLNKIYLIEFLLHLVGDNPLFLLFDLEESKFKRILNCLNDDCSTIYRLGCFGNFGFRKKERFC